MPLLWMMLVACTCDPILLLLDENNYSYTNAIDIEVVEAAPATDVLVDWSGLGTDLQLHAVDPANDIDNVVLISFPRDSEVDADLAALELRLEALIAADTLKADDTDVIATFENTANATSARLSEFLIFGTNAFDPVTYFTNEDALWLLRLTTGLNNTRMARFVQIVPSGPETVTIGDDSATLDFQADLQSATPGDTCKSGLETLDWSGINYDGAGNLFNPTAVDRVILAHYETATVADLEAQFFDIELIADGEWEAAVLGTSGVTSVDLADLTNVADGSAFPGLESGTWVVALQNTIGTNPAPLYLAVLDVR